MNIEFLSEKNLESYITYLKRAVAEEPAQMWISEIDEQALRDRIRDPFYRNTRSLLAIIEGNVVARIEYHFYGCFQDGYRMAYVDWVYVLRGFRHQGIAQKLFRAFEEDCAAHHIHQYYLIRATNRDADKFYHSFDQVELDDEPVLRKTF